MSPTSSLLLIECVIPTRNKPHFGKYLDLDMPSFAGGAVLESDHLRG